MLDFAELVATPVGRCEDGTFHTLPSDQVELGLRELGGGIAKCERCGTIIYVPPGR